MNTITEADVRAVLGPGYKGDRKDVAQLVASANADPREGVEWLPYYKLALAVLAEAAGQIQGLAEVISRDMPPDHLPGRVVVEEALRWFDGMFRVHLRVCGLGPDHGNPKRVAKVEKMVAEVEL